jgi:hypothetical protein
MKLKGSTMVEGDHEGDDKDFLLKHKHCKIQQTPSHSPKLWPPIISRHYFHGFFESKMACSQNIMPNLENLKSHRAIKNIQKTITIK